MVTEAVGRPRHHPDRRGDRSGTPTSLRASDQVTDLIVLSLSETQNTATAPVCLTSGVVDVAVVIEQRGKLIPAFPATLGKVAIAAQFQSDLKEANCVLRLA